MKNRKIHEFALPNQAKPLCVKFGLKSHAIMVAGDNQNNITLWRLNKDRPLATLAPRQTTADPHAKEITSVCYALNQLEIFSGNNVGSFGVWNIQAQQMTKEFKEHSAAISCISPSFNSDTLVITGSLDSTVKQWDTRQKGSVMTYAEHTNKINCIEFSPDGTLFITGSDDQLLKLWDIRTRKCIKTFNLHKAPITCAKFNPEEITLATTSSDGILNYWDLENFELMFQSNVDSNEIQQIAFDQDGGHFFTAAKDILRVWRVNADGLSLMTNVESKWDCIQDLVIQNSTKTPTPTNALIGAVLGKTSFELWGSQFDDLKKIQKEPITVFKKFVPEEEDDSGDIPVEMSRPQVLGRQSSRPFEHFSDVVSFEVANQEADSPKEEEKEEEEPDQDQNRKDNGDESPQENEQKPEVEDAGQGHHAEEYDGSKVEENLEFHELLESTKFVRASIIYMEKNSPTQLDLSAYLNGITGEDKKNEFDAIGEISKEHAKFEANMMQRAINVRQISSTWKTERALKTLPTLEKLAGNDSPLILSLITISVIAHKIEKLPLEIVCVLLRKVPILIETNFDLYIRVSLGFSLTVLEAFDKEIIPRKVLHTPNKIAQPKVEIPRKYAKLISTFEWFTQQEIIKKLANKTDNQLGKIAKKTLHDVGAFLVRVNNPAPTPVRTPSKAKK